MERLRHGYSHDTRGDGKTVVKRHVGRDASQRARTERTMLRRLAGRLPVPEVLDDGEPLVMAHVAGVHGQELIDAGHAAEVLRSCGAMLRRLHEVEPGLVHGDYGPNNMLFDPETFEVTAILDWELAYRGDPVDDLAWCEWIVRMHHPSEVDALADLFAGYGHTPPWPDRQRLRLAKCHQLLDRSGAEIWRDRIAVTAAWTE